MHKPVFIGLALGIFTMAGAAAAQYPPPLPPPPPPSGGYGYAPPAAFPVPRAHFGNQGEFVFSSNLNGLDAGLLGHSYSNPSGTGDSKSDWHLTLQPAADYFVIQGLSVGGFLQYTHSHVSTPNDAGVGSTVVNTDTYGIGARVGYNISFADAVSWWPLLGLGYATTGGDVSSNALTLSLFAPILYHPVSHFFMGIGPIIATDLSANGPKPNVGKETTYGLQFVIGGWFLT
jgi:hypothetical protein